MTQSLEIVICVVDLGEVGGFFWTYRFNIDYTNLCYEVVSANAKLLLFQKNEQRLV